MIVQYKYITWNPPYLTDEQELELGRQIALVGREHFVREFRKSISSSAAQANEAHLDAISRPTATGASSPLQRALKAADNGLQWAGVVFFLVVVVAGFVVMSASAWAHMFSIMIPLLVLVLCIWFVSVHFATRKFEKWVDHLVARYAAHVARGGK